MDLIQAIRKIENKDRERNQRLGQKSMLVEELRALGFKNIEGAEKQGTKLTNEISKMDTQYENGEKEFKKQFGHLLT